MDQPASEHSLKVVLLGDGSVGKTSSLHRYIDGKFQDVYSPTMGVDILHQEVTIDDKKVNLQFWDIGGQDHFAKIRTRFYRNASLGLLVFDVTNKASFDHLDGWVAECYDNLKREIPLVLVGNKIDLVNLRMITSSQVEEWIANSRAKVVAWFETSAYTGVNVLEAFHRLAKEGTKHL